MVNGPDEWSPEDLTGLVSYYDQGFDADPVGQWDDEFGSDHLTEATNKPDQVAKGVGFGLDFVRANSDELNFTTGISLSGDFRVGFTVNVDTSTDTDNYVASQGSVSDNFIWVDGAGALRLRIGGSTKTMTANGVFTSGVDARVQLARNGTALTCVVNGSDVTSGSPTSSDTLALDQIGRNRACRLP